MWEVGQFRSLSHSPGRSIGASLGLLREQSPECAWVPDAGAHVAWCLCWRHCAPGHVRCWGTAVSSAYKALCPCGAPSHPGRQTQLNKYANGVSCIGICLLLWKHWAKSRGIKSLEVGWLWGVRVAIFKRTFRTRYCKIKDKKSLPRGVLWWYCVSHGNSG